MRILNTDPDTDRSSVTSTLPVPSDVPTDGRTVARTAFDRILVIVGPGDTGPAMRLALGMRADLTDRLPDVPVAVVMALAEPGARGRDLAREASASGRPLLVSVSRDGDDDGVVDGIMQSGNTRAVCLLVAAAPMTGRAPVRPVLTEVVAHGRVRRANLLSLSLRTGDWITTHYAHTSIGVGLVHPDGEDDAVGTVPWVDSLSFAVPKRGEDDTLPSGGGTPAPVTAHHSFRTSRPTVVLLDREPLVVPADVLVSIDVAPRALRTIG